VPDAQQLVLAEKDLNGRMTMKQIMPVRFSLLDGADELAIRLS
jgi:protein-L-isoaspartate(D-aspartate) O-methyltransferase